MKQLIAPLFVLIAGLGGYGLRGGADEIPTSCDPAACRVSIECVDPDTCVVTCYDEDDEIVCQQEVDCDEPCEQACEAPCEAPAQTAAATAGEAPRACCPR